MKSRVSESFSRAARFYNDSAHIQKMVAKETAVIASSYAANAINPSILDCGCGTGFIFNEMGHSFPNIYQCDISFAMCEIASLKNRLTINSDIEMLPFKDDSFDIIVSSLALQWCEDINIFLSEAARVLKKNGKIIISVTGENNFPELSSINELKIKQNLPLEDYNHPQFKMLKSDTKHIIQQFSNLHQLLKSIQKTGASMRAGGQEIKHIGKHKLSEIEKLYASKYSNLSAAEKNLPLTWEIYYIVLQSID